jgi:hypothetical protein
MLVADTEYESLRDGSNPSLFGIGHFGGGWGGKGNRRKNL